MPPPVLLLHGLATSPARTWHETGLVDLLSDAGRTVLAPTLPGHGPGASHSAADYDDLAGQVAGLFPDEPAAVVGFSLGGQLALRVALAAPERIDRLALAGVGENLFRSDDADELAEALVSGDVGEDVFAGHFLQLAVESGNDPAALAALLRCRKPPPLAPSDLAGLDLPILVIAGERDFVGPIDRLVDALPDVRSVILPGVDHFQTPKAFPFIDAVLGFLDAVPS